MARGAQALLLLPLQSSCHDLTCPPPGCMFKKEEEEFDEVMAKCDSLPEASQLHIGPGTTPLTTTIMMTKAVYSGLFSVTVGKEAIWNATGEEVHQSDPPQPCHHLSQAGGNTQQHGTTFFLSLKHTHAVPSSNTFTATVHTHHSTVCCSCQWQTKPLSLWFDSYSSHCHHQEKMFLEQLLFAPSNEGVLSKYTPKSMITLGIISFHSATHIVFTTLQEALADGVLSHSYFTAQQHTHHLT